jgi:hypothetical protein
MLFAPAKSRYLKLLYPLLVAAVLLLPALEASHQHDLSTDVSECLHCQSSTPGITSAEPSFAPPQVALLAASLSRAAEAPTANFYDLNVRGPPPANC